MNNMLLSDLLRPQKIADLCLETSKIDVLERMDRTDDLMNMTFFGRPGTGKTSCALLLAKDRSEYRINGATLNGDNYDKTIPALMSRPLFSALRCVVIDEADAMTIGSQEKLRYDIERLSANVNRFILTTNDLTALSDALRSRCYPICFDPDRKNYGEITDRLCARYEERLKFYNLSPILIRRAVEDCFPDMRRIANALQFALLEAA